MNIIWSKEIDEILQVGHYLEEEAGIRDWALNKAQALRALNQFLQLQIPVLGGDVCELRDGRILPNYDNWYCDPLAEEMRTQFLIRSISKARDYIESYKTTSDPERIFFTLTPDIERL